MSWQKNESKPTLSAVIPDLNRSCCGKPEFQVNSSFLHDYVSFVFLIYREADISGVCPGPAKATIHQVFRPIRSKTTFTKETVVKTCVPSAFIADFKFNDY